MGSRSHAVCLMVLLVLTMSAVCVRSDQCEKNVTVHGFCACGTDTGVIDLGPLIQDHKPLKIAGDSPNQTFYWNPCGNFNMSGIQEAGMIEEKDGVFTEIGQAIEKKIFMGIDTKTHLPYFTMMSANVHSYSEVFCVCDKDVVFDMKFKGIWGNGVGAPITYGFNLTSRHCCPGYFPSSSLSPLSPSTSSASPVTTSSTPTGSTSPSTSDINPTTSHSPLTTTPSGSGTTVTSYTGHMIISWLLTLLTTRYLISIPDTRS